MSSKSGIKLKSGWYECKKILGKKGAFLHVGEIFQGQNIEGIEIGLPFHMPGDLGVTTTPVTSIYQHGNKDGFDKVVLPKNLQDKDFEVSANNVDFKEGDIMFSTYNSIYLLEYKG